MLKYSSSFRNTYTPVIGRVFLNDSLYGFKYRPNISTYQMPYLYVKTLFLCATGGGLRHEEMRYIRGLVDALLPSKDSHHEIKQELLQYVDSIPLMSGSQQQSRSPRSDPSRLQPKAEVEASMDANAFLGAQESLSKEGGSGGDTQSSSLPRAEDHEGSASFTKRATSTTREPIPIPFMDDSHDASLFPFNPELEMKFISPEAFPPSLSRVLLYDAVCACVADGVYSAKKRDRVFLVAALTGLSPAVREPIERLALQEKALSNRKRFLLHLHQNEDARTTMPFRKGPSGEGVADRRPDRQGGAFDVENSSSQNMETVATGVNNCGGDASCSASARSSRETWSNPKTSAGEVRTQSFHESFVRPSPSSTHSMAAVSFGHPSSPNDEDLLRQAKALLRRVRRD
ncbi:unnamed protein product [Phytomonas sp. EM1]|nr:unnamed protein product [Phytomonas sp. EM1]|eukprot:CCW65340.1 unnamed protein product [Phytomonas sp. isolate EM1]